MGPLGLDVGQRARRAQTVTAREVELYAQITGDRNPLHFDPDFAARTRFGRLVAQGGIAAGMLNELVAMDLPGPGTVFMSQALKYLPRPIWATRSPRRSRCSRSSPTSRSASSGRSSRIRTGSRCSRASAGPTPCVRPDRAGADHQRLRASSHGPGTARKPSTARLDRVIEKGSAHVDAQR